MHVKYQLKEFFLIINDSLCMYNLNPDDVKDQ